MNSRRLKTEALRDLVSSLEDALCLAKLLRKGGSWSRLNRSGVEEHLQRAETAFNRYKYHSAEQRKAA